MFRFKNKDQQYAFYAWLITLAAMCLRFYRLDFHSLWLDELYTVKECDPGISWKDTVGIALETEHKSPLYFLLEKLLFCIFGYTPFVSRSLCVVAGTLSVYAMYMLGKEILSARAGIIAALLTCVNTFHVHYSQEARGYLFVFLFCALAMVYFIRTLKQLTFSNAALYGLYALLSLHFHPFGVLALFGQGAVIVIYFFTEREKQRRIGFIKYFSLAYAIVLVGLLPLAGSLRHTAAVTSMWIPMPAHDYFISYFFEFFGSSELLKPVLLLSLLSYIVCVLVAPKKEETAYWGISFSFVLIFVSLVIAFVVPYFYSIYKVPVLVIRYMIVVLPLLILALSIGLSSIENKMVRNSILAVFLIISLLRLKYHYTDVFKTQYRELTEYIKENSPQPYPVIHYQSAWHLSYYFDLLHVKSKIVPTEKEVFVDEVKNGSKLYPTFWLAGAHNDPKLSEKKQQELEQNYRLVKSKDFLDAWAQLYVKKDSSAVTTVK